MKEITQKEWVRHRLVKYGYITRNECLREYISRLSSIIHQLKADGMKIKGESFESFTRWGECKDYRYILEK